MKLKTGDLPKIKVSSEKVCSGCLKRTISNVRNFASWKDLFLKRFPFFFFYKTETGFGKLISVSLSSYFGLLISK